MILGISCFLPSTSSDEGLGISARAIASTAPFSKRRPMRVLQAWTRKPIIIRFITRKIAVPRRIVQVDSGEGGTLRAEMLLVGVGEGPRPW